MRVKHEIEVLKTEAITAPNPVHRVTPKTCSSLLLPSWLASLNCDYYRCCPVFLSSQTGHSKKYGDVMAISRLYLDTSGGPCFYSIVYFVVAPATRALDSGSTVESIHHVSRDISSIHHIS